MHQRPKHRGFTIVEMLAVIGVIVVLLAILVPTISSARRSALWGTSQSNLKQVGQLLMLYVQENRDAIAPTAFDYSTSLAPGKVRSASPASTTPPIGPLSVGTWTDILWTTGKLGPTLNVADTAANWDYRFDSPDAALYASLAKEAATFQPGGSGLLALDWNNGNRTVLVDPMLSGLLLGTTLHTTKAEIYRALIEATAFGARTIIERIESYGVPVKRIVCAGGIAEKNPLLMQIYADVTGRTMLVAGSSQACALGSAVSAAVLAGVFKDFPAAQKAMTSLKDIEYKPRAAARKTYDRLFALYQNLHDAFGGVNRKADLSGVMKELLAIKSKSQK